MNIHGTVSGRLITEVSKGGKGETLKKTTNQELKDLLYSTGNSTQYPIMTYMGKESKKGVEIHFGVHLKLTQHCKSALLQ